MPLRRHLAPALVALAVAGAPLAASAQSFSNAQRGEIESIIKNYLVTHPEILEEASAELSKRHAAAEAEKHTKAVTQNAQTIFHSPRGVTLGNPKIMLFYMALLPTIIDLRFLSIIGWAELTATMLAVLFMVDVAWVVLAVRARRLLKSPAAVRLANRCSAGVMAGAAAAIATR